MTSTQQPDQVVYGSVAAPTVAMRLRSAVPDALVPALVGVRTRLKARKPQAMVTARREMEFLLGEVRPDDVERAARAYLERYVVRSEFRYHERLITRQPVHGLEALQEARNRGRGVILSFLHHGHYEGAVASIARVDRPMVCVVSPEMLGPDSPAFLRQHVRVGIATGNLLLDATLGSAPVVSLLEQGEVIALATDVPGNARATFLGRERTCASGAARLAKRTNCLVVRMWSRRDADGTVSVHLDEALDPQDFADADALLAHLVAAHEEAVLAWPDGYDRPLSRWGVPEEPTAG